MDIIQLSKEYRNEYLIACLRKLLIEAEEGQLQSFAGVGTYRNGDVSTIKSLGEFSDSFKLIGAVAHLQFVLTAEID